MDKKAEILIHPTRMKIIQALMRNKDVGMTPLEMAEAIKDVSQATLYRHIQVLRDADIIKVAKEQKVRGTVEKFYTLNEDNLWLNPDEWESVSYEEKLNFISYYHLMLLSLYQNYLTSLENTDGAEDRSTFSIVELRLKDEMFEHFQEELNDLIKKYYKQSSDVSDTTAQTVAITMIPEP